ncbi:hypothetical protein L7F22_055189 [Adiantum nelumboides]|nr:hypothetical protein [Adiantum nelumboides]
MPQSMCSGLISLIPKVGDTTRLRQWRPITLLSLVYKILAKLISSRLRPFLPDLIHMSQTGFVQDRCILDNLFSLHRAMDWARTSGTPLAILLLDYEKAYDRVDWGFLEGSLDRMGFSLAWIRGIFALYRSASSSVIIGGHVGCTFQLSRSVRQGCPLAPYLFLLLAETMADLIKAQEPALIGLLMPVANEPDLIDQEYADDTLLFLHYSSDVLDWIRYALEVFCVAVVRASTWDKSYGILAGLDDVPTWGPGDFTWLRPGETCRYLGISASLFGWPCIGDQPGTTSLSMTFSQLCVFNFTSGLVDINYTPYDILDSPRFKYRGILIDTSRHYQPIDAIKQVIDSMAYAKFNVLHWHIVDEESFPIEIPSLPELWNGAYTPSERYTVADAREIVGYAKARGIKVMAEIDVPGHAESWGYGYPELWPSATCREPLDVSNNFTFEVIDRILSDFREIFPFGFFHLGGDEVNTDCWNNTPQIKEWLEEQDMTPYEAYMYFVLRVQQLALSHGWEPVNWVSMVVEHARNFSSASSARGGLKDLLKERLAKVVPL